MVTVATPNRGEVWLINFEPAVGAEIRKVRPGVVVNLDTVGSLPLRIVVPITDWKPRYSIAPWFVALSATATNGLLKDSGADVFQTKSISLTRFVRRVGQLTSPELASIVLAIKSCVGAP